ncbi:hypothetical protein KJ359_001741 [Pestalotiopsis sp. 9143b]|nr:hypothetical protein KJ359_001741 [Pestalotiopsis sp. 9143b]
MAQATAQATATRTGGDPDPHDTTGLCLLSLDGGGVRGLSTIYILERIMHRLNDERMKSRLPRVKPCEVFDLIGGTGTGGLIAIMLGRLEMDVDQCIEAYNDIAKSVFGDGPSPMPVAPKGKVPAPFDLAALERAIRKMITASGASEKDVFNDGAERGCKTFVCTADRHTKDIVRLRSYTLPEERSIRATICEAALATSATTTFFQPVRIAARSFADGGLGANNPVDEVEGEASNIWCPDGNDLKPLVKCFISIGTGNPGKRSFEEGMADYLAQTVVQIATETEATETKFIARWMKHFDEKRYFRLNVDQGLQDIGLVEYEKEGAIEAATDSYLGHADRKLREYDKRTAQLSGLSATPFIVPFGQNHDFVGRGTILEQLMTVVPPSADGNDCQRTAIEGLGGTGKTQIALEIAYRVRKAHPSCSVFWVPAVSMALFEDAYRTIGQILGVPNIDDDKADVKILVKTALEQSSNSWLLILDNADDVDLITGQTTKTGLRAYLPFNRRGSILITTRNRNATLILGVRHQNSFLLSEMSHDEAIQILEKELPPEQLSDMDSTKALLEQLSYLPLAIKQASAYMAKTAQSTTEYLGHYRRSNRNQMELLSRDFEDRGRYTQTLNPIATTWLISFQHLSKTCPLAARYLKFICFLAEKDIPTSLLPGTDGNNRDNQDSEDDEDDEDDDSGMGKDEAIGALKGYAFITARQGSDSFDIHRLVRLAMRNWVEQEEPRQIETVIQHLSRAYPFPKHENRDIWLRYMPHINTAIDVWINTGVQSKEWRLIFNSGSSFEKLGKYQQAEKRYRRAKKITQKVLGAKDPSTLGSMNNLAVVLRSQGKYEEAEAMHRQTLELTKSVLGAKHPDTLASMNNLALVLRKQGKYEEAEAMHQEALKLNKAFRSYIA